jgi:hypothetical protein
MESGLGFFAYIATASTDTQEANKKSNRQGPFGRPDL